jgi:hypothetical protein
MSGHVDDLVTFALAKGAFTVKSAPRQNEQDLCNFVAREVLLRPKLQIIDSDPAASRHRWQRIGQTVRDNNIREMMLNHFLFSNAFRPKTTKKVFCDLLAIINDFIILIIFAASVFLNISRMVCAVPLLAGVRARVV